MGAITQSTAVDALTGVAYADPAVKMRRMMILPGNSVVQFVLRASIVCNGPTASALKSLLFPVAPLCSKYTTVPSVADRESVIVDGVVLVTVISVAMAEAYTNHATVVEIL